MITLAAVNAPGAAPEPEAISIALTALSSNPTKAPDAKVIVRAEDPIEDDAAEL